MGKDSGITIVNTPISFIVNEEGVAEEVTVSHHLITKKGLIIKKAIIRHIGTTNTK